MQRTVVQKGLTVPATYMKCLDGVYMPDVEAQHRVDRFLV